MTQLDLSVVLPAWNEGDNIGVLIRRLRDEFEALSLSYEVIVVDGGSSDNTWQAASEAGAECLLQRRIGYGGAVREGFARARGDFVLTMDCDLSHPAELFPKLWDLRNKADVIIGSRFVKGGKSDAPMGRQMLSRVLNQVFNGFLALPVTDSSSGYRLYRRQVLTPSSYRYENFNILQEILIRAYTAGYSFREVPLHYKPRASGESHVSLIKFSVSYLPTLYRMWVLRNSSQAADYEDRAYRSIHPMQRYWQRKRRKLIASFIDPAKQTLDLGCGSSRITQENPSAIAFDSARQKLRFLRNTNSRRVCGSIEMLPFADSSLEQIIVSQVLPYIANSNRIFEELNRVLNLEGRLIISVPDSSRVSWKILGYFYNKLLPNIFEKQRSNWRRRELGDMLADHGFKTLKYRYIGGAELIIQARKVESIAGSSVLEGPNSKVIRLPRNARN